VTFKLPKVTDISVKVNGRRIKGSYSIILGNLVVYYRGRTSSIRKPETDLDAVASQVLEELIRQTRAETEAAPNDLPPHIRAAAAKCVEDFEEDRRIRRLIDSFGPSIVGSDAHMQVSWLCLNVLTPVVPAWKSVCDDDAPEQILAELRGGMSDPSRAVGWERAERPLVGRRNGIPIGDCNACWIEPIARGVAGCANYLRTANVASAVTAIQEAWTAYNEGCWPQSEQRTFEKWFVDVALVYACRARPAP
jgi:hypothetical protein